MPQHPSAPHTPGILSLYADLRSQLCLDASPLASSDHFSMARERVAAARHSFKMSFNLQSFLTNVGGFDQNLNDRILGLSPDTIIRDENVIRAWAELLSLRKLPHSQLGYFEGEVWSAVDNLVTIATIASKPVGNDPRTQPPDAQPAILSGSTATCSPVTPRKPPLELPDDTPVHANSGLHFSTSPQTHANVDPYLRTELRDTVLKDVRGFSTFFNGITETEWDCAISCPPTCACRWPEPVHTDRVAEFELAPTSQVPHSPLESVHNDRAAEAELAPTRQVPHFPSNKNPSQDSVLDWFATFNQIVSSPQKFYSSPTRALSNSNTSSKRQCDLFLAKRVSPDCTHGWQCVLLPAELKASPSEDCTSDTIVQLASYVREVFGAQFNRRFVHAFTICGPYFRCYLFDRAGVSISRRLCITKNDRTQALFARILVGYMDMSAQELGFDIHYLYPDNTDPAGPVSNMPAPLAPQPKYLQFRGRKFELIKKLFHRAVIVSRGTLCWLAEDVHSGEECVIKDSWRASWRTPEGQLLELAGDRGVLGITRPLVYGDVKNASDGSDNDQVDGNGNGSDHDQVDSITNLRSGLSYTSATRVMLPMKAADGRYFLSSTKCIPVGGETTGSGKRRSGDLLGSERRKTARLSSSSQTRIFGGTKSSSNHTLMPRANKSSRNQTRATRTTQTTQTTRASKSSGSLKANSYHSRSSLKSQTRSQTSCKSLISAPVTPGTTTEYSTLVDPSCPPGGFMQLTHSVVVTTLVGERIENFGCIRELLEALRDAIRCHQSLVESGGILHRDISPNNIMIDRSQSPCHPSSLKGFLIDLDLAKELPPYVSPPTTPSSLRRRTGTMFFMAIEILKGTAPRHTWRHDLESFLYVLIWLCICCPKDSDVNSRALLETSWSAKGAGNNKLVQMTQEGDWKKLMGWFAPSMREKMPRVARGMRDVLFPAAKDGMGVELGTGSNMAETYQAVLAVVDAETRFLADEE